MTSLIMFIVGIALGAGFCFLHMRTRYFDMKAEMEYAYDQALQLAEENRMLVEEKENPWR